LGLRAARLAAGRDGGGEDERRVGGRVDSGPGVGGAAGDVDVCSLPGGGWGVAVDRRRGRVDAGAGRGGGGAVAGDVGGGDVAADGRALGRQRQRARDAGVENAGAGIGRDERHLDGCPVPSVLVRLRRRGAEAHGGGGLVELDRQRRERRVIAGVVDRLVA